MQDHKRTNSDEKSSVSGQNGFVKLEVFKCTTCDRLYFTLPVECSCHNKIVKDNVIGPFKLLEKEDEDKWKVVCRLCDMIKVIHRTNVKRSASCGCKPRHINIILINQSKVKYRCQKCNSTIETSYPVIDWCCNVE